MTLQSSERPRYSRPGGNPHYPHSRDSGSGYNSGGLWGCLPRAARLAVFVVGLLLAVWIGSQVGPQFDGKPAPTHCCWEVTP